MLDNLLHLIKNQIHIKASDSKNFHINHQQLYEGIILVSKVR